MEMSAENSPRIYVVSPASVAVATVAGPSPIRELASMHHVTSYCVANILVHAACSRGVSGFSCVSMYNDCTEQRQERVLGSTEEMQRRKREVS